MALASSSSNAPLQNIYYERKVATPKSCYICKRPTSTVLATIRTEDFLYTCDGHLGDVGFASAIAPPPAPASPKPSAEDIKKVINEFAAKDARKAAKSAEKGDDSKETEKDKSDAKDTDSKKDDKAPSSSSSPSPAPAPSTAAQPTHRKFALHRQIFEMRKAEIKKREMGMKAKEVGKGLPQVPRGSF